MICVRCGRCDGETGYLKREVKHFEDLFALERGAGGVPHSGEAPNLKPANAIRESESLSLCVCVYVCVCVCAGVLLVLFLFFYGPW